MGLTSSSRLYLGEVPPSGYLEEKQESVWWGRRSEGWKVFRKGREHVQTPGRKSYFPSKGGDLPEVQG